VLTGTNAKVLTPQVSLAESSRIGSNRQEAVGIGIPIQKPLQDEESSLKCVKGLSVVLLQHLYGHIIEDLGFIKYLYR
jgi:hypothetical protein